MSFDISTIEMTDTFDLVIIDPRTEDEFLVDVEENGRPVRRAMSITLWSPGTKEYRAAQAENRKRLQKAFKNGKLQEEPEQEEARLARWFQECTVSFNNFTHNGGDPKDAETHRACYADPKSGWITQQVNVALDNWGKSMKTGAKS